MMKEADTGVMQAEPRNVCSLLGLEKARNGFSPTASIKVCGVLKSIISPHLLIGIHLLK